MSIQMDPDWWEWVLLGSRKIIEAEKCLKNMGIHAITL